MTNEIKNSLKELGFNDNEIRVYVALTQLGEATALQIAKKADLPRTTAISILNKLKLDNYLTTHRYKNVTYYWIESPKILVDILESKVETAKNLSNLLTSLYRSQANFPSIHLYDTKTSIKQFIEKTLANLEKKEIIYTIDAPAKGNYSKISENIEYWIMAQKKKKQITTRTLIPNWSFGNIADHKIKNQDIKIREMPPGISFKSSLWIIKNMMVHFSGNPPFAAAIKHETIVPDIKSIYDFLWSISEPKN